MKRHVRTMTGVVTSDKMDKTVVVRVERRFKHSTYGRYVRKSRRLLVHDENGQCQVGDQVLVTESRPLSARKRWCVSKVLRTANLA